MATQKMKKEIIAILILFMMLGLVGFASAASLSLSLGSYDSEIYTQETVNIPVIVTASNITGSADVTLTPKSGLSCSTCTLSYTFTGASSEQGTVTFTLTGTQTGTYNPPFNSISAVSGSTSATPLSSGSSITVVEAPTWVKSFEASDSNPSAGETVTLTLTINPSGTFEGVSADLTLTGGLTRVSGSDPRSIGTISGTSTYQWTVSAASSGTASVALTATNPTESAGENTETLTITVPGSGTPDSPGGGGGGAATTTGKTYTITEEQFSAGISKDLKKGDRFGFTVNNETHYVKVLSFTESTATIEVSSTPQTATLSIGGEKKFELTGDSYYDLSAKLDSINYTGNTTTLTVKSIHEEFKAEVTPPGTTPGTTTPGTEGQEGQKGYGIPKGVSGSYLSAVIIILVLVVIVVVILVVSSRRRKRNKKVFLEF